MTTKLFFFLAPSMTGTGLGEVIIGIVSLSVIAIIFAIASSVVSARGTAQVLAILGIIIAIPPMLFSIRMVSNSFTMADIPIAMLLILPPFLAVLAAVARLMKLPGAKRE